MKESNGCRTSVQTHKSNKFDITFSMVISNPVFT